MILSFDIGGTRIRAARVLAPAEPEFLGAWPTPAHDFQAFAGVLAQAANQAGPEARIVALSMAGVVDPDTGRGTIANIPCLDGRDVAGDLRLALGLPVIVANDADCFALAEAVSGAGRGHRSVFGVILGTGVGGGLVIDGRIVTGPGGYAGEWGHGPVLRTEARDHRGQPVHVPQWPCGCGLPGCVDSLGGARGLEKLCLHMTGRVFDSHAIVAAWRADADWALAVIAVWVDLVSAPLAMVLNTIGASVVPVGGGLSNAPDLIAALDVAVRARILRKTGGAILMPGLHRLEPGLIGAAMLAAQALRDGAV